MKVKAIRDLEFQNIIIPKGEVFTVANDDNYHFFGSGYYKVTEGKYKGYRVLKDACTAIQEKTYSEKEWNYMQDFYKDEIKRLKVGLEHAESKLEVFRIFLDIAAKGMKKNAELVESLLKEKAKNG